MCQFYANERNAWPVGTPDTWAPAGNQQEGALAPLWKCCKVFCALQNAQQTNYLCIIFTTCRRLLEALPPGSHRGSIPGQSLLGDFCPQSSKLPTPGKKILRAPRPFNMSGHCRLTMLVMCRH